MLKQRASLPAQDECSSRMTHSSAVLMNRPPSKRRLYVLVWFLQFHNLKCFPFHPTSYHTRQFSQHSSLLFPKRQRDIQQYSTLRIENNLRRYSQPLHKDDFGKKQENSFGSSPNLSSQNTTSTEQGNNNTNYEVEELEFIWEVGDVYQDFDLLEQAINFSYAKEYLVQTDRMEMLDEMAAQRRLVLPDLHHFVTRTLRFSAVLVFLKRFLLKRGTGTPVNQALYHLLTVPFDVHFWVIGVVAPIIFLKIKQWTMPPPPPIPHALKDLREYAKFIKPQWWEDPTTSCRDYILCLLEQWTSAVKGFIFFTLFRLGFAGVITRLPNTPMEPIPVFSDTILAIVRLFTRLGAMVSLFQYPELLFQLRRRQQPRPLKLGVAVLQSLVKSLFRWGIPLGVASDISQAMVRTPPRLIIAFYGTILTILSAMEVLYNQQRKPITQPSEKLSKIKRLVSGLTVFTLSSAALVTIFGKVAIFLFKWYHDNNYALSTVRRLWLPVVTSGALIVALFGPLCHLIAFKKLFRILYTHDVSLSDPDDYAAKLNDPKERERLYNWRYKLKWREPQRISVFINEMPGKFWYWLFLEGSVHAQVHKELEEAKKKRASSELPKIWDLDEERNRLSNLLLNRTQWKKQAMDRLADVHQKDYDANGAGHVFRDPLGVAVQQRLGIGLGFKFDHTRKLKDGERPSVRRLQARAAKSAVQRATTIYEERIRRTKELQNATRDAKAFEEGRKRIFDETEAEIQYLAKRLSDLIPPEGTYGGDSFGRRVTLFNGNAKITRGENTTAEVVIPGDSRGKTVDSLMGTTYEIVPPDNAIVEEIVDEFNRMQTRRKVSTTRPEERATDMFPPDENDSILSDREKDEFVEALLKEKFGGGGTRNNDDGDDDDMRTYLA